MDMSFGNLDTVKSSTLLPVGNYPVRAVNIELKDTKARTGKYIDVQFEIVSGQYQGAKVFQNFNVINQNQQAVEIAMRQIKQWLEAAGMDATGELTMSKIEALEGRNVPAKVGIEKGTGEHDDKNKIMRFLTNQDPTAMAQPVAQPQAQPQAMPQAMPQAGVAPASTPAATPWAS